MAQFEHAGKTLCDKYLFIFGISCVEVWHGICFRENNDGRGKWAYKNEHVNAANFSHDVNATLFIVTNIHPKAKLGFYQSYQCFF